MSASQDGRLRGATALEAGDAAIDEIRGSGGERLIDRDRGVLIGSYCPSCAKTWFPGRALCPRCFTDGVMTERALGRHGLIYASTIVRVASSLGHPPPYAYGYVDLAGDDVRVISRFSGSAPERFVPGTAVELVLEAIECSALDPVLGWAFRLEAQA